MTNPVAVRRGPRLVLLRVLALLTALGIAAGLMVSATRSEAAPADPISQENLPWNADLEWQGPGDWQATGLWEGEGPVQTTKCLRGAVDAELGAQSVYQRDYEYPGGHLNRASALIMDFESNQVADEAYGDLATWATECAGTLEDKGFTQVGGAEGHRVAIPGTEARFTEIVLREHGDDREEAYFESIGAVRDGNKIALVSMSVWGLDSNWSYDPDDGTGLDLHPMFRSMPKVADRLVG